MIFTAYETDDGQFVVELDQDGINYLQAGLAVLADADPGTEFETPSIIAENGHPTAISSFVLRRAHTAL